MRAKENYQKQMDALLADCRRDGRVPSLLLHSCCAPCSSYVLEYLSQYFTITVFYYNPNIWPPEEYEMRVKEQKRLIAELPTIHPVRFIEGTYDPERFFAMARGMEDLPEGGERCRSCYRMRLEEAAATAEKENCDYFCTTLSISPMKNAQWLNEEGMTIGESCAADWLPSDFKKKNGYQRSIELSREYHLYRQNYCGCVFSKAFRESTSLSKTGQP